MYIQLHTITTLKQGVYLQQFLSISHVTWYIRQSVEDLC